MSTFNSRLAPIIATNRPRLIQSIVAGQRDPIKLPLAYTIGALPGEGIGPELVAGALQVLDAVADVRGLRFEVFTGAEIGLPAIAKSGRPLTEEVVGFCSDVFERGGAILAGAGGDRFVYEMRRRFDLFCKLNPVVPHPALHDSAVVKSNHLAGLSLPLAMALKAAVRESITNSMVAVVAFVQGSRNWH
ncbi:MAG: isocitrate/isopropylmalate family dehydrogenase [Planctomycetota bacterium]|nr:isocitrate/isopropylmalate family dehydrogenase [Planctomycetota bacterium]MDA1180547.1 isocitrate/isopropylmalate family dehydrogenase [Planctomycetota bacterium]